MDEEVVNVTVEYPVHANVYPLPNEAIIWREHEVYKPSGHTINLASEKGRTVYPELFIENYRLGTLVNLSVGALARHFGAKPLPIVASNPSLLDVHYDALDIEMPLAECYFVSAERFWKRVVLAKHRDKSLILQSDVKWKNLGISLKFVELVEACPAEYWPEDEMKDLALKIKDDVEELHIKRLQSLRERSFEKYFHSESESSSEESEDESEEEESDSSVPTSVDEEQGEEEQEDEMEKTESQLEFEREQARKKAHRKRIRQEIREAKAKEKALREQKRQKRAARRAKKGLNVETVVKKIPKNPKDVFKIPIVESEDDGEAQIVDKRNKALYLAHLKKYTYPAEDCHHIDLRFIQYFINLETLIIEFWGAIQQREYHVRHRNFSLQDIKHLAAGLSHLHRLKTFRLRNSRMDEEKLLILCRTLAELESLQTVDFGNDQLNEHCGYAFQELFEISNSVCNLELESNNFNIEVLTTLGTSLKGCKHLTLEYLGLARNPLNDDALHALISCIVGTKHVSHLNLKGCRNISEIGISCSLASELITKHEPLLKLDISGIPLTSAAADEIIIALTKNQKIIEFNCCACELDEETDIDVSVLMQRNKYCAENYFVGNESIPNDEIEQWLNRMKNSVLIKVLAERQKRNDCLSELPPQFIPSPSPSVASVATSQRSLDLAAQMYDRPIGDYIRKKPKSELEAFDYPANDFDEKEFLEHVAQPGPEERYYYFQKHKKLYSIRENVKNVSMI